MAAIAALAALTRPVRAVITIDSTYVRDGITRWIHGWRRNGWKTAGKQPVKNSDLWRRLDAAIAPHQVEWLWTRGHSGHPDNERADRLAREAAARQTTAA